MHVYICVHFFPTVFYISVSIEEVWHIFLLFKDDKKTLGRKQSHRREKSDQLANTKSKKEKKLNLFSLVQWEDNLHMDAESATRIYIWQYETDSTICSFLFFYSVTFTFL